MEPTVRNRRRENLLLLFKRLTATNCYFEGQGYETARGAQQRKAGFQQFRKPLRTEISGEQLLKEPAAAWTDRFARPGLARKETTPPLSPSCLLFRGRQVKEQRSRKAPIPQCVYPLWNHWSQGRSSSRAKSSWWARALRVSSPTRTNWLWQAKAVKSVKAKIRMSICTSIEVESWW